MVETTGQPTAASDVDFVALKPGQTIGRYEIMAILGQGGFGITYRARDTQLDREVAIKEYLPSALAVRQGGVTVLPRTTKLADDFTWGRQRFVEEGRTLATLQRAPAIVRVFDFLEANGTAYIVMELVPGETLEHRLKRVGKLKPAQVDQILWPLLEGLEQVHNAGFLHRDIKPANILLGADGNPTLIDFGASRAAMAGRTGAMTAIFTPGYAAAEQMTSAKQGPWTDIYSLSATLYHAITGAAPPSSFDRMLEDAYQPLGKVLPVGFAPGLLVGVDAGLALRATDRPQTIAGWRTILTQTGAPDAQVTVALGRPVVAAAAPVQSTAARRPTRRRAGQWVGIAAVLLLLAGGGYYVAMQKADEQRAEQEAAVRRQAEGARRKAYAELAEKKRLEDETRVKAEADERRAAEAAEMGLHLLPADRQRVQAALTALGFDTGGIDGVFNPRTRETIASWQRGKGYPATGFLTGIQYQALLREAAPALAKYDEDQKKTEEARRGAQPSQQAAIAPPASSVPATGVDGLWRGAYHCTPSRVGGDFTMHVQMTMSGGVGIWVRPGSGPGTMGNQSLSIKIDGSQVLVSRVHTPGRQAGVFTTGTMIAHYENGTITGTGPEQNSGGRTCTINLTR